MARSEFDEHSDNKKSRKSDRRNKKRIDENDDDISYRDKRSSKRFHRKKTLKDEFWENYTELNSIQKEQKTGPDKKY